MMPDLNEITEIKPQTSAVEIGLNTDQTEIVLKVPKQTECDLNKEVAEHNTKIEFFNLQLQRLIEKLIVQNE